MEDFTIGLALYDFVPVLLTGVAVYFIATVVRARAVPVYQIAVLAAGLVFAAGLSKAIWKLIATLAGQDLVWLASMLFPLMAPGFALLAAGIWASQRRKPPQTAFFWLVPVVMIAAVYALAVYRMGAGFERGWFMPIMALASLSNIALTILLFSMAWRRGLRGVAILFTVNLGMVFALIPIAQMDSHSIAMHWLEQTLTAIGSAAFAYSAFRLSRDVSSDASVLDNDSAVSAAAGVDSGVPARSSV